MLRRSLVVLALLFVPPVSSADATDPSSIPGTSLGSSQVSEPASDLGPATDSSGAGSSTADGTSLQPAGNSPLQSTSNDSSGLTAPTGQSLQQSGSASQQQLQVVLGDADGQTHNVPEPGSTNYWGWFWFTLIFALMAASLSMVIKKPVRHVARLVRKSAK